MPKLNGFKVAHLNIASLLKHHGELLVYMQDKPFDILTLNETRLDSTDLDCETGIPGYDVIRHDRKRNGGGLHFISEIIFHIQSATTYCKMPSNYFVSKLENLNLGIDHRVLKLSCSKVSRTFWNKSMMKQRHCYNWGSQLQSD